MSQLPPPTTAPAGWYPDPVGSGERYFDGRQWAEATPRFAEPDPHPTLPIGAAIGALVVLVASLIIAKALVEYLIRFDWSVLAYVVLLATIGYGPSVAWIIFVRRRWGGGSLVSIGFRFRWSDLGWGPVTWIAAVATQVVVAALVLVFDIPLSSNVESVSDLEADRAYLIATTITAVIMAPIIEEIVFRGLVMRGLLSRCVAPIAIAVQGMLFGLAHVDPVRGVGNIGLALVLSGVGIAFGMSAYLTRRLGAAIIGHAIFNGVVLAIVLTGAFGDLDNDLGRRIDSGFESVVVDQAHVAEPGRQQHHRW